MARVHVYLIGVIQDRPQETEQENRGQDRRADDGQLVLQEYFQAADERAAGLPGRRMGRPDGRGVRRGLADDPAQAGNERF